MAQIEVRYTEAYAGLLKERGTVLPFSTMLADTYRSHNLSIQAANNTERLPCKVVSDGSPSLLLVQPRLTRSVRTSMSTLDADEVPSQFSSSDETLNDIWRLGARTVLAACFEQASQPSTWSPSAQGVLVPGQRPALTRRFYAMEPYTLAFESRIEQGGTGGRSGFPVSTLDGGLLLYIATTRSHSDTASRCSIRRASTRTCWTRSGLGAQKAMARHSDRRFRESFAVTIDGQSVFNVSLSKYWLRKLLAQSRTRGSFGLGPWQDHVLAIETSRRWLPTEPCCTRTI